MAVKTTELVEIREILDEVHSKIKELSDSKLTIMGKEYNLSEWITISDYAKKNDLSMSRVQQWVSRGVIPQDSVIVVPELNYLKLIRDRSYETRATR